ncbi:hypothetical protein CDAR_16361 [Caerostris darwini]|uniref:Uncharacterized protein n=1 Tax=Caerostris darwini TaxID=1538125 RepID=A0AAV4WS28_9ARAC|nr:hypothetical protein CDAR_16361 [Caerostris darwini]
MNIRYLCNYSWRSLEAAPLKDIGDTVPVVIREQPISFDPGSSADIVIKDEFVVCSENGTSADVPPLT